MKYIVRFPKKNERSRFKFKQNINNCFIKKKSCNFDKKYSTHFSKSDSQMKDIIQSEKSTYLIEYQLFKPNDIYSFGKYFHKFDSCLPITKLSSEYNSGADVSDFYFFTLNRASSLRLNQIVNDNTKTVKHTERSSDTVIYKNTQHKKTTPLLSSDWIFFSLIISIVLFGLIKYLSKNLISSITQSFLYINTNLNKKLEIKSNFSGFSLLLNLFFFWNISLFLYQAGVYYSFFFGAEHFAKIFASLILIFAILRISRHILTYIPSEILKKKSVYFEINRNIDIHNFIVSFFLIFVIASAAYLKIVPENIQILIGFTIILLIFAARITKTIIIFLQEGVSFLHLFLYLCTLEIMPLLIVIYSFNHFNNSDLKLEFQY